MMEFTRKEIERSIENMEIALIAIKQLWLEEGDEEKRETYKKRYEAVNKRIDELDEMLGLK